MNERSLIHAAIVQALVILAFVAAIVAGVLRFTEPLWKAPPPPPPAPPASWIPCTVGSTGVMLWRPSNWPAFTGSVGGAQVLVLQASPTASVIVAVWPPSSPSRPSPTEALAQVIEPFRRHPGFWAEPFSDDILLGCRAIGERASWWVRAGLIPVAWHARAMATCERDHTLAVCITCDRANWSAFLRPARLLVRSITLLPARAPRRCVPPDRPPAGL